MILYNKNRLKLINSNQNNLATGKSNTTSLDFEMKYDLGM